MSISLTLDSVGDATTVRWPRGRSWRSVLAFFALAMAAWLVGGLGPAALFSTPDVPFDDAPPFVLCGGPVAAHAVASGAQPMLAEARPRPVPTVVSSEKLAHVPGKRVTTVVVDFPPGSHSPAHRHGGSVSVYVLKGSIYSQLEGGPMGDFNPGDTFFEPLGIIHLASGNRSATEHAQILAVFVHDEGAVLTTYLE